MKIQQFDGGLNTRLEPQLLRTNQGVVYENVDNTSGVLRSFPDKSLTELQLKKYAKFFRKGDEWLSSDVVTDYLEFQNSMFLTDRVNRPQKYRDGVYNYLGIESPAVKPDLSNESQVKAVEEVTVSNQTSSGTLPGGSLNYIVVNVNGDYYSMPYQITVDASGNATTTASGSFDSAWTTGVPTPGSSVNTVEKPTNRSVKFSSLRGRSGSTAHVYRWYEEGWYRVGSLASGTATLTDTTEDISGNIPLDDSKITSFFGVYTYVYTFYNSSDGTESKPSPVSVELEEVEGGFVRLSNIEVSPDPQVDKVRIYRVGNNIAQFTLVEEIANGTLTYDDELRDTSLDGRLLESDNYDEAPSGLKYLTESYAMVFGAIGSSLRFTPIGKPNAWPVAYSLEFDGDITGIGTVASGLLVMTENKVNIVTGTGPLLLAQQSLRGDQGCIAHESVQQIEGGSVIWASKDGLCTSSGNNVVSLTKQFVDGVSLSPVDSEVLNEVYYCHNSDGTTIVWDYRFSPIVRYLKLGVDTITKSKGSLFGWRFDKFYELFSSDSLEFIFKSALMVEGSFTEAKTYKKVYIRSEGVIILNVIIDNVLVTTKKLEGTKTHVIQVPQSLQRGYSIQFEVTGTGVVHEIEYVAGRRKDG